MSRYRTDSVVQDREMRESAGLDRCPRVVRLGRIVDLNYIVQKIPRQRVDHCTRHALSGVGHAVRQTTQSNLSGADKSWPGLAGSTIVLPTVFPTRDTSMASRCRRAVQPKRLSEPPRHVRRLHLLGTAQDASPPPWSGKSCADVAFEQCPGEHDWWVRVAVDPDFPLVLRACLGTWWWR